MTLFISQLKIKKKLILIALLLFVTFGLIGCSANNKIQNKANEQIRKNVVFDIPSLLDKNASEIKKILGKPSFDDKSLGNSFKTVVWEKNNYKFSFDLNLDGSIRNQTFILIGYTENKATVKSTLEAGNLDTKSSKYETLFSDDGTTKRIISIYIKPRE